MVLPPIFLTKRDMKKITRQKSAQNDLPYPFTGLKVVGWGGGGILGLGLGLDNSASKYFHISLKY